MSGAVSVAFFDPDRELYGTARQGTTLLFAGSSSSALAEGPKLEVRRGGALRAGLDGRLELDFEPSAEAAELGGVSARLCRVKGKLDGKRFDGLGTVAETREPPSWEELDALRGISALVDAETGLLALARRPRGALGHGQERVTAAIVQEGRALAVEEARISTVYDGEGRQRSAGIELWLPGEDFPRRGSGVAVAGSSLELEGIDVHVAVFRWRLEGREGIGAYELTARGRAPAAA